MSPGARRSPADRTAQIRLAHRSASNVTGQNRGWPTDGYDDHASLQGLMDSAFLKTVPLWCGRLREGEAQVDGASTDVDPFDDRRG